MVTKLSPKEEGKNVISEEQEIIGVVIDADRDRIRMKPSSDFSDELESEFGDDTNVASVLVEEENIGDVEETALFLRPRGWFIINSEGDLEYISED